MFTGPGMATVTEKVPSEAPLDVGRVLPILENIPIFGALSNDHLHAVFSKLKLVHYQARDMIFKQGDQPSYVYIVLDGEVRLEFDAVEHPLSKVRFLPGECFGETSVVGIQSHSASTIALVETDLLVLSREALLHIFESDKALFGMLILNIAREVSRRLHQTDELLLQCVQKRSQ